MERLARLRALSWLERRLLAESLLSLALASLVVALLPFRMIERFALRAPPMRPQRNRRVVIGGVGWAVRAAARRAPFRAKCFEQGLAALWMLRRRGVNATLHYGAARQDESLVAHVWVTAEGEEVIGCGNKHLFFELASFPKVPRAGGI